LLEKKTEASGTQWAVQLKSPNTDLKAKLIQQQGMNEEQAAKMVQELEENTSEML